VTYVHSSSDGNIRYFEYENDKFEFLSEYKSADPQRGIAFVPRRGINVHENEVMRAYKTVNDAYIEPISFTVPRRAETFQSDIFPPATGLKPAMSAKEWFDGKTAVPAKIDLESIYDGNAPVEVPADYKPAAVASASAPAPAPAPAPKKEPEPAPAPVRAQGTMADQKASISSMANKFQDDEEEAEDDDDAETSSFEEISRPAPRTTIPVRSPTKPQPVTTTVPAAQAKPASPVKSPQAAAAPFPHAARAASPSAAGPPSPAVEASLAEIKELIEKQGKVISAQTEHMAAQTQLIAHLTGEVETLKKRVSAGTQDQSERIRQLELELEAARS
jgi:coronin-1B/1C/6